MATLKTKLVRLLRGLRRPSPARNASRLRARGEDARAFVIREATADDIPALARVHVVAWNDTYPGVRSPPTPALRERQWRERFASAPRPWFCYLAARPDGEVIGFAQGNGYAHADQPDFAGELNKIYLLRDYQRLGLGRRLMGRVARRFLAEGVPSMLLFADAGNPSLRFYEALGGEGLREPGGGTSESSFGWKDLRRLAELCRDE